MLTPEMAASSSIDVTLDSPTLADTIGPRLQAADAHACPVTVAAAANNRAVAVTAVEVIEFLDCSVADCRAKDATVTSCSVGAPSRGICKCSLPTDVAVLAVLRAGCRLAGFRLVGTVTWRAPSCVVPCRNLTLCTYFRWTEEVRFPSGAKARHHTSPAVVTPL